MASILDKYGIKEVADVTFYALDDNGIPAYPVLYLDTLKVSTIEQTAEETTANGGKGNVPLISWDYNKDITVTLEDALFSAKSMAIMFGNGTVSPYGSTTTSKYIMKTEVFTAQDTTTNYTTITASVATGGWDPYFRHGGKRYEKVNAKFFNEEGTPITTATEVGQKIFCSYDLAVIGSTITISADSFPGTYYVVGDTFARSEANGNDEFFQFIISKAKVTSENTITMEAEGDPSVFNMNLHVLRPENGEMMKLVKYNLVGDDKDDGSTAGEIYHNHYLNVVNDNYSAGDMGGVARPTEPVNHKTT